MLKHCTNWNECAKQNVNELIWSKNLKCEKCFCFKQYGVHQVIVLPYRTVDKLIFLLHIHSFKCFSYLAIIARDLLNAAAITSPEAVKHLNTILDLLDVRSIPYNNAYIIGSLVSAFTGKSLNISKHLSKTMPFNSFDRFDCWLNIVAQELLYPLIDFGFS